MKTLRLFGILDHLRMAPAPVPAEVLADVLEVSVRTIYRDMATLQALGAPIRGAAGLGYQLEPGYFLPPLQFDPDEQEAIMLGLRLVLARADPAMGQAARRVMGKIGGAMNADQARNYRALPLQAVARSQPEMDLAAPHMALLRRVIRDRWMVDMDYLDLQGRTSRRRLRPLGLTLFDSAWLLTGWCETAGDFRNFRVDRITGLTPADERFRHQAGRRFRDYLERL